jgi:hypothetical protein
MRRISAKLVLITVIATLGMYAADNNMLGTWKRDVARTKMTPPPKNPVTSLTTTYEAAGDGLKVTVTGERQDGTPIHSSFNAKLDGKEYDVPGAPWDKASMKQIDANTFTSEMKKTGGKFHTTSRTVISKDGKTMTTTVQGTNEDGQPVSGTIVAAKQ